MSIYEYKKGDHKAGFIGWRVAVLVGDKYCQKYFNIRKVTNEEELNAIEKEAKSLDAKWNFERKLISDQKKLECKEKRSHASSIYNTGISGIKMKFGASGGGVRGKKGRKYYTPFFLVSGSTNNKRFIKNFNIITNGYDWAWMKAVKYYADEKGIEHYSHLLERKPPVEKFIVIRRYSCSLGHDIPLRRLPKELKDMDLEAHP